jgi:RNA polymerase sigma-70 factor (ECF subfamily)
MAAAKHRAIDLMRRDKMLERKHAELGGELAARERDEPDLATQIDDDIGDDLLRLIFTACHPVPTTEARVCCSTSIAGSGIGG